MALLASAAEPAPRELQNTLPRHYGYLIGDLLTQHVRIAAPLALTLDQAALPRAGHASRFFDLQAIEIKEHVGRDERIYDVVLRYQVVTTDDIISLAALPRPSLKFGGTEKPVSLRLSEQHVSVTPLSDVDASENEGLGALRPERGTPLFDTTATQRRMIVYALALTALGLFWLYRIYGIPFLARSRGPFFHAWRALRHPADSDNALRKLHHAFDQTFGRPLFSHEIGRFVEQHPRYALLREPIHQFFETSRRQFFAAEGVSDAQLSELRQLAHRLSVLERGLA